MKFRKKPVIVDAEFFSAKVALDCLQNRRPGPFGLFVSGEWNGDKLHYAIVNIDTLEGVMCAKVDRDWIIKGVKGELYPCKDDIFRETYEPEEEILCPKCGHYQWHPNGVCEHFGR